MTVPRPGFPREGTRQARPPGPLCPPLHRPMKSPWDVPCPERHYSPYLCGVYAARHVAFVPDGNDPSPRERTSPGGPSVPICAGTLGRPQRVPRPNPRSLIPARRTVHAPTKAHPPTVSPWSRRRTRTLSRFDPAPSRACSSPSSFTRSEARNRPIFFCCASGRSGRRLSGFRSDSARSQRPAISRRRPPASGANANPPSLKANPPRRQHWIFLPWQGT
jgi:hypothetical protein